MDILIFNAFVVNTPIEAYWCKSHNNALWSHKRQNCSTFGHFLTMYLIRK